MYFRKLNLNPAVAEEFLNFVNNLNKKILSIGNYNQTCKPSYWYITEVMNGYFFGYTENNNNIDKNLEIQSWKDLDLENFCEINFFQTFDLLNIIFCLYKHNFPVHRHSEWLPGSEEYYKHVLVVSNTSGELHLCSTDKPKFHIPQGDITHIDHLLDSERYDVEKIVPISRNDIFVFDSSTWHTFITTEDINQNSFTTTFVLADRISSVDKICDRLELIK